MLSCSEKGNKNPVGSDSDETCKVTGKIVFWSIGEGMRDVIVEISGETINKTTVTDENGDFSFDGLGSVKSNMKK